MLALNQFLSNYSFLIVPGMYLKSLCEKNIELKSKTLTQKVVCCNISNSRDYFRKNHIFKSDKYYGLNYLRSTGLCQIY